ncbi:unnamed protein product [Amoebophrya sp. A120]|nr:unnamed protein product [Amoebophrya sp. A120]|eukprot:GSA120T00018879001.1
MGKKKETAKGGDAEQKLRIAIVSADRCKPKKCKQECKKYCPVVRTGKMCVEADRDSKNAWISESLCIGCGICVKKCPFEAINIINLPKDLGKETTHRYGPNTFKLHRLPMPRPGQVLGLVGTNGIGKSTALKVLSCKLKPNLGRYDEPPDWSEILQHFRGSELQAFFSRMLEDKLKSTIKLQYVDQLKNKIAGKVGEILEMKDERKVADTLSKELEIDHLLDREVKDLSGGELQRFAILVVAILDAQVYMFDEPSSYLDVKQRLAASRVIRTLMRDDNYIIVVEHDLAVLDYLSDYVCCLWGAAGAYGVVSVPSSVREGINIFLDGFLPSENLRFREVSLTFKVSADDTLVKERMHNVPYPALVKQMGEKGKGFILEVEAGNFCDSEIIVMLGQNGTGKTTFIRMLAGLLKSDEAEEELPKMNVSYKPQTITAKFQGTVEQLLLGKIRESYLHPQFQSDVVKPMLIEQIKDQEVQHLSGGELQRVALVLALGKPADMYLIDEPSAYLDVEQRIVAARVIKRYILHAKKTAFIVEHDFIMATYLADRVIVYEGTPGVRCTATTPKSLVEGMNQFLQQLDITFRRDPTNYRPRINKMLSVKDREQKEIGKYFVLED